MKILTNEAGNKTIKLPVSGQTLEFRSPKGKDLRAIDRQTSVEDITDLDTMFFMAGLLSTSELTTETLDEMDAEDVAAVGRVITSFPVFSGKSK